MRILFADDSMTAQNMGKKILTEAGYDVVAVSNGAAAVKKIAEQKPDIVILDIYMPGYTGLEVCDKLRASVDTLKIPVLLTVGKMEPYRAEDANRVRADGVIIKPFEASDLLAVIKKLEERVVPRTSTTTPITEQTILLERPPQVAEFAPLPSENHTEIHVPETVENSVSAIVDVPDNMATSAAFSDLLGPEPTSSFGSMPVAEHAPVEELSISPEPPAEHQVVEHHASILEFPAPPAVDEATVPVPAAHASVEHEVEHEVEHQIEQRNEVPEFVTFPSEEAAPSTAFEVMPADAGIETQDAYFVPASTGSLVEADVVENEVAENVQNNVIENAAVEVAPETASGSIPDTQPIPIYREHEPEPEPEHALLAVTTPETPSDIRLEELEPESGVPPFSAAVGSDDYSDHFSESGNSAVPAATPIPAMEPPAWADSNPVAETASLDSFSTRVDAQIEQIENIVSVSESRQFEAKAEAPVENGFSNSGLPKEVASSTDDDFEARVAAAMSVYDETDKAEASPAMVHQVDHAGLVHGKPEPKVEQVTEPASFETPYSFEYSPPVKAPEIESVPKFVPSAMPQPVAAKASIIPEAAVATAEPVDEPIHSRVASHEEFPLASDNSTAVQPIHSQVQVEDEKILGEIAAQIPVTTVSAAANTSDPASETQIISAAVHRVLERLKPQLIEEISKELKKSK